MASLPIFGTAHIANLVVSEGKNKKGIDAMTYFLSKSKYGSDKSTYLSWLKCFIESAKQNSPFQLDTFLAYWLNYFVFPSPPGNGMHPFIFPMVVSLTQGKRLTLAPWYLGAFHARINKCSRNITRSVGRYDVVSYVGANSLQLFLLERF